MRDVDPRLSKLVLAHTTGGAVLNLISSIRTRGPGRSAAFLALAVGLTAIGEFLATGPLKLLRHRTKPRVAGVPVSILLGWYCAIHGSHAIAQSILSSSTSKDLPRGLALPLTAALVGTSLDLILDPAGLDTGLWEWNADGFYAREIRGANGRAGVPLVNYLGWLLMISGVVASYERAFDEPAPAGRLPVLLMLLHYLVPAAWAAKKRRIRYLILSLPFSVAALVAVSRPSWRGE